MLVFGVWLCCFGFRVVCSGLDLGWVLVLMCWVLDCACVCLVWFAGALICWCFCVGCVGAIQAVGWMWVPAWLYDSFGLRVFWSASWGEALLVWGGFKIVAVFLVFSCGFWLVCGVFGWCFWFLGGRVAGGLGLRVLVRVCWVLCLLGISFWCGLV